MPVPLISIRLPNLNPRLFLDEQMKTLLAQTFVGWEIDRQQLIFQRQFTGVFLSQSFHAVSRI